MKGPVETLWNENAETWHEAIINGHDIFRDHLNTPAFLKMLPDIIELNGIEIACGEGGDTKLLAKLCKSLTAIDFSKKILDFAKEKNHTQNVNFIQADARQLPFENNSFDFAVSILAFMDIENIEKVLSEIFRVLKPNGFLQFSILHPCFSIYKSQWIEDENKNPIAIQTKDYFVEDNGSIHEFKHHGSPSNFPSFKVARFHKPMHKWINLLIEKGFQIEMMTEPSADNQTIEKYPELASTRIVAHTLIIRARKVHSPILLTL